VRKPHLDLLKTNVAKRLLADRDADAMPHEFMGQNTAHVEEGEAGDPVFSDASVAFPKDVLDVLLVRPADPCHVWVESDLKRLIAESARHLDEGCRVWRRALEPLCAVFGHAKLPQKLRDALR